jgi:hypothetical protein
VRLRHTLGWIAPLALALLAAAVVALVPATPAAAAGAAPITVPFDHLTTGFELDGVHRDLPCESCHLNAVFRGTPRDCGTCHIKGSLFNATPKTTTHIPSTNKCAACHNTISFRPDMHFSHAEVMGSCVSCHNGTIATGMTIPPHPRTNQNCAACHTVISWNPPSMVDHTQIPLAVAGFCIICHNGKDADGKNAGHIATSLECGDCHLTTTWLGANFDHTGITTGCVSCHNGTKAVGKQGNHMPTTNLCEDCHTTGIGTKSPSWVPSKFDHTQMTVTTCETCHSGTLKISTGFVSGKPVNHVPTVAGAGDCSVCHGNTPTAETWTVLAASIAILHKGLDTKNCVQCHGGQTFAGVPAPYIPMSMSGVSPTKRTPLAPPHIPVLTGTDCSACHGAAYQAGGFGPATAMSATTHKFVSSTCDTCHDTGKSFYVGSGTPLQLRPANHVNSTDPGMAKGDCSACHNTADWTSNTMPAGHMPNPSNLPCTTCHASAPNDYTPATLAPNSKLHTGITANCGLCHGDTVTALTWANNYTPKDAMLTPSHIPYLSGTDCSSCHSSATYAAGTFGPMNMTQAKHSFVPTACNTCHEAGLSFYMGAANPALQGRPADHTTADQAAPNDCSKCHTTANWNSTVIPAGHMPNPGNQGCSVCHTAISTTTASYATLASIAVLHTGIAGNCGLCHGNTTQLTFYNNNDNPKAAILTPSHIPYTSGADCSSCHAANYVAGGFGPTNMTAAKHAFVPTTCDSCHEAGLSFYLGASTPPLQGRPASHLTSGNPQEVSGDCSGCHNTTDWTSTAMPSGHMPTPGTKTCSVCHTTIGATEASYATLASVAVLHTGVSGNCGQCHGATVAALTWYNNYTPKDAVLAPAHIPYISGSDCSSCHTANYVTGGFGPTAMSAAKHAFVPTACASCHEAGLTFYMGASTPALQGRPAGHLTSGNPQEVSGDCSGCHNTTDWTSTAMPTGHMPTPGTKTCSVCHIGNLSTQAGYATLASVAVLHTGITANCSQCHGNYTAALTWYNNYTPKDAILTPSHIPYLTGTDCSSCHASKFVTGGFSGTTMSAAKHAFVPTTCDTCHDTGKNFYPGAGLNLQTRPPTHVSAPNPASQAAGDCSLCHNTTVWTTPTTLPDNHMPIPGTQTCSVCHVGNLSTTAGYATMATIPVLHTGITTGCAQCHGGAAPLTFYNNNDNPKAAPANHIPSFTNNDCSACHKATYVAGGFGPMNMTQATHANVATMACRTCHEAGLTFYMGAANPGLQGRPVDHTLGQMVAPNDCATCHTTANWNSTMLPANHMPNPANTACNTCHINAPTSFVGLAANAVLHTGIAGNCGLCHGGTTALTWYNSFTPKDAVLTPSHIPYLSGTDCASCHTPSTYALGAFGPMNMTQAKHSFVTTSCVTCHEKGKSFYMGTASPALQLRPADHTSGTMLTSDCSVCHTTANWNSTTMPAGHMPNPANQACTVCHTAAPTNYTTLAANSVLHTGIKTGCTQCHGATTALTWYNNFTPKDAILTPAHIPYISGTDCASCHSSTTYAVGTFGPMNMTQAKHTFVATTCVTCHEKGKSFYMGTASPALQLRPADHTSGTMLTADCSGCHTTANWNSTAMPAGHMPNPANTACNTCHTAAPTNYTTLAANSVLHTGIKSNCGQCHGGATALTWFNNFTPKDAVLAPAHIPYLSGTDCASCHSSTTYAVGTFGPMNMTQAKHAFVTTTCVTCHEKGKSFYMGTASPALQLRPADHTSGTMLTSDCSACHTTANWNSGSLPAGHMPNPANQGCNVCHTAAPTNYTTLATNAVLHTGIASGCITCHGAPNATKPVFYLNFSPKAASGLSPPHIPTAATACESCHAISFTAFSGTTMSAAKHTAMLAATGGTCDQCHDLKTLTFFGVNNLTTRPNGHHVGQDCKGCHSPNNWGGNAQKRTVAAAKTPANSTIGTVVTASAATRASALPAAGPSGGDRGFRGGPMRSGIALGAVNHSVSHAGVTGNCASCHNGVLAAGKSAAHIASNNTCQNCHTTIAWLPARFDHQGVTAKCVSCHNGVVALGKPTLHVQSNQDCSACHGTLTWSAVMFSHLGINAACQSCHNGITATGKQVQHVRTTLDCSSCHNTLNWTVVSAPAKPVVPKQPRPVTPIPRGATGGPTK